MRSTLASAIVAAACAVALASGCSPAIEPAKLAAVQVASADAPPSGCRQLGPLEGKDSDRWVPGGPRYETAMLDLRKKAVLGGGNAVVLDAVEAPRESDYMPAFVLRARLFVCGAGAVATAAPAPPAAALEPSARPLAPPVCEPDCSPGYTCLRGTCVSACNPLCTGGERCGADRICHPAPPPIEVSR